MQKVPPSFENKSKEALFADIVNREPLFSGLFPKVKYSEVLGNRGRMRSELQLIKTD